MTTLSSAAATTEERREVHLPRPHAAQAQVIREAARFNVLDCGRRWGKTTLGIDRLLRPALEGKPAGWFSPTYKMLSDTWRIVRRILAPVTERVSAQEHRLELVGGGSVEMWSLDAPDSARGRKYALVIIDEAAAVRELQEAWEAVIRPTLADYQGGAWFLSTPRGHNYFHELYQRGADPEQPDWASWQMPTRTNPHIAPEEIAAAQRDLPGPLFAQEYEASFLALAEARFNLEVVNAALAVCRAPLQGAAVPSGIETPYLSLWGLPRPGVPYVAYTDSAEGKGRDYTVTVVLEARTLRHVATLRDNTLEPGQHATYADKLGRWFNEAFWGVERNRGEAVLYVVGQTGYPRVYWHEESAQTLQQRLAGTRPTTRLGFPVTEHTRLGLIDDLAQAIDDRSLQSDDAVFWRECQSFVHNDRGRPEAAPGAHDDCVLAIAGAVRMARQPGAQTLREASGTPTVRGYAPVGRQNQQRANVRRY